MTATVKWFDDKFAYGYIMESNKKIMIECGRKNKPKKVTKDNNFKRLKMEIFKQKKYCHLSNYEISVYDEDKVYDWKDYLEIIAAILAIVGFPIEMINNIIESNKPTVNINCSQCEMVISDEDGSITIND